MRDRRKCTVYNVQRELAALVPNLQTVDLRLARIAKAIQPSPHLLPVELRGRAEAVRVDLLGDAIATLEELSQLTEEDALCHRVQLLDLSLRLADSEG